MKIKYICKLYNKEFIGGQSFTSHLKIHKYTSKQYYDEFLKTQNDGICQVCGKPTKFFKFANGYRKTCSDECYRRLSVKSWRKTMNDKYNGGYYSGTDEYREKRKLDCLEKYNCEYYWQAKEIKEKRKESMLERYNVEHTMQKEEFKLLAKEHREETNLERYGVKHNWSSEELREQGQYKTCMEKYGYKYPCQNPVFKEKYKQTCLNKYGVDNYAKTQEYIEKTKQTNLEKYGFEWTQQSPEIHKKQMYGKYHAPNGKIYDSSWEYLFEQYLIENNIPYIYQSDLTLSWTDIDGKEHKYIPDFLLINDKPELIEIKGDQFFDENGNFINPYDKSEKGYANAQLKWECMMNAGVKVYTSKELKNLDIKI